jgi:diadenosine tetraphosphate (Ap4A) HIT family hydrolase
MNQIISPQPVVKPCVFCTLDVIKNREIVANELAWAFPTNIPITPGHTLISPKRCVRTMEELTVEEHLAIFNLAKIIMRSLRKVYGAEGFNCAWNQEKLAGQTVPHFHLHIIARKEGDAGLLGYDPRSMLYRTGEREPTPESELIEMVEKMKSSLE